MGRLGTEVKGDSLDGSGTCHIGAKGVGVDVVSHGWLCHVRRPEEMAQP